MKKFLFTTLITDDLGLLTRTIPVAKELKNRGHKVAFCNPANAPSKMIEEAGIENLPLKHPLFYLNMAGKPDLRKFYKLAKSGQVKQDFGSISNYWRRYLQSVPSKIAPSTSEIWNMDHFWTLFGSLDESSLRCSCEVMMDVIKEYDPDVVIDSWNLWAGIAARALKKPLITIIQAIMHPESQGFVWWKEMPKDIPTPVPVINKLLEEYSLQPVGSSAEFNVGDLTLIMGTPETDPLPENTNAAYIGSILWQKQDINKPDWFEYLSKEKPVIWAYTGNPQYGPAGLWADSDVVLDSCIAALADEDVQVVLTSGHHSLPKRYQPLPANFKFESFVPGLAMAERCDLMIHHGGFGSCQTGLFTGTPAIIIPTYSERESNARRIAAVGAGDFVLPAKYSAGDKNMLMFEIRALSRRLFRQTRMTDVLTEELRVKVKNILADSSFAENAKKIGKKMSSYGGASEAARLIEELKY